MGVQTSVWLLAISGQKGLWNWSKSSTDYFISPNEGTSGLCQEESGFRDNFPFKGPGSSLLRKPRRIALQEAEVLSCSVLADKWLPSLPQPPEQIALWGSDVHIKSCLSLSGSPQMGKCLLWLRTTKFSASGARDWLLWTISGCSRAGLQAPRLSQHPSSRKVWRKFRQYQNWRSPSEAGGCETSPKRLSW